jgi:hypothetical protein
MYGHLQNYVQLFIYVETVISEHFIVLTVL